MMLDPDRTCGMTPAEMRCRTRPTEIPFRAAKAATEYTALLYLIAYRYVHNRYFVCLSMCHRPRLSARDLGAPSAPPGSGLVASIWSLRGEYLNASWRRFALLTLRHASG